MSNLLKNILLFGLNLLISLGLFVACGDDSSDTNEHGQSLQTQAVGYSANLNYTLGLITTPMHDARISVTDRDFTSAHCEQVIRDVYNQYETQYAPGLIDVVGLINNIGVVQQSHPEDFSGQDRWDDAVYQSARTQNGSQPFAASDMIITNTIEGLSRKADIMMFVDDGEGTFHGVLYITGELGWSFEMSLDPDNEGAHEDRDIFVLDYDDGGRILDCSDVSFIGQQAENLDEEFAALWQEVTEENRGYTEYFSDNLPGAGETGGQRTVGWSKVDIYDQEWVIVVTEPKE